VPQDVYLLDATLRENIAFGESEAEINDAWISTAMTLAQLDDLVNSLPEGMETVIGERGARLSGGQRQRIGIARALYIRPQLLLLDEATSALDNETERRITSTIESLHGKMTIVVIAHRLSTIRHCDRVAFLNHGIVETVGTFEDVRRGNATFSHLVDLASLESNDGSLEVGLESDG
jgi:ABC-type multidrug transport system fused ATPase/permease subunit